MNRNPDENVYEDFFSSIDYSSPSEIKSRFILHKQSMTDVPSAESGLELSGRLVDFHDAVITNIFNSLLTDERRASLNFCVVALGGYGRRELNVFSDIDINFIYKNNSASETAAIRKQIHRLVKYLWDIGLEVGHSVRVLDACSALAEKDIDIKTSFLEARFLSGSQDCYHEFQTLVREIIFTANADAFILARLALMEKRHERFGNSGRMLEPHLKEGAGGLRDMHTCFWITRARLITGESGAEEAASRCVNAVQELVRTRFLADSYFQPALQSFDFLMRTRNTLHRLAQRRDDVLSYPMQSRAAERMGYTDHPDTKGVERFMRDFYRHTRTIANLTALIGEKLKHSITHSALTSSKKIFIENDCFINEADSRLYCTQDAGRRLADRPPLMMKIFLYAQKYRAPLSEQLQTAVREHLHLVDDTFIHSREIAHDFLEIWKFEGQVGAMLKHMHDLGFLENYIPEFGFIDAHYNYNVYHAYTTDEHLIVAVHQLEKLFFEEPASASDSLSTLREVYRELSLFEKYQLYWAVFLHDIGKSRGGDHSLIGADLARTIFQRLQYEENADAVYFLILNHLRMEQLAFRRNLKDTETVSEFGNLVGNRRWLRMLYLLTFADMSAANPAVWTEWKAALLQELFIKADRYLKNRHEAGASEPDWEEINYDRIQLSDSLQVTFNDKNSFTETLIITTDLPYRLSQICAVMAVCDVSILDAEVYTRTDGIIIDQFRVANFPSHTPLSSAQKQNMEKLLKDILIGGQDIKPQLEKLKTRWKRLKFHETETEIYFEDNRKFTIIDIFTADRVGLLYLMTQALSDLGLNIYSAKIGTRLDGAADCFYVLDHTGNKINSIEKQEEIRKEICRRLENN